MKCLRFRQSRLAQLIVSVALTNIALVQLTWAQQNSGTSFVVVDAKKKVLGPVIGTGQGGSIPTVAIKVKDQWLPVAILRNQILPNNAIAYASPDTGQAYGDVTYSAFQASAVVGTTLYGPSGPVIPSFQVNSTWSWGSCYPNSYVTDVAPLAPVLDLSIYTPPFTAVVAKSQDSLQADGILRSHF